MTVERGALQGCAGHIRVARTVLDFKAYLNRLASAEPTPGGGSAAALVGALGAALVAMVARITLGSPKHAAVHADALLLVESADALRSAFIAARSDDETAYAGVVAAQALPRDTAAHKAERRATLQHALAGAAEAPLQVATLAAALVADAERAATLGNDQLMSDVECALAFGRAALDAAAANVRINHRYMDDASIVAAQAERLDASLNAARTAASRAVAILLPRG